MGRHGRARHDRRQQKNGPLFAGMSVAREAKTAALERAMLRIDSHEDPASGYLPKGIIAAVLKEEQVANNWMTRFQIDGLRKRRNTHREQRRKEVLARKARIEDIFSAPSEDEQEGEGYHPLQMGNSFNDDSSSEDESRYHTATAPTPREWKTSVGRKKGSSRRNKAAKNKKREMLIDDISETWFKIVNSPHDGTQLFEVISLKT